LNSLNIYSKNLSNIKGLSSLVYLKELILFETKINKIKIVSLIKLEKLHISNGMIKEIKGLVLENRN
jgi:hypothetical protein